METIRFRKGNLKVAGFKTRFATYGKNIQNKYRLEVKLGFGVNVPLYHSDKKPMFRDLYFITVFSFPIIVLSHILIPIFYLLWNYYDGAVNFYKDGVWQQNVREFNWVNIFIIFVLSILLIFKW